MDTNRMEDESVSETMNGQAGRHAELQQQWHGWESPVGIGLGLVCFGVGVGVLLTGIAAISAVGVLLS